ncbi:hypothetical protein [Gulosibacter sp. 10]|uniref:hypothetical protein n=1 Tax=Gulosibacter sp. 10 TaxID=1255570 RepID=UPI00097EC069|nr:hypothetical protein [Gulosibacter sp. 10]SJM54578.1 Translation initiation factor 2 [Gulosibacter sp. 10]
MFGWFRKLTQREDTAQQRAPERHDSDASLLQEPVAQEAPQREVEPAEEFIEVYTPEPMPEPPTFAPPLQREVPLPQIEERADSEQEDAQELPEFLNAPPAPPAPVAQQAPEAEPAFAPDDREVDEAQNPDEAQPGAIETPAASEAVAEREPEFDGLLTAPSPRPAMPLSAHPNFAGLGLAEWEPIAPRLLEPEAALTPAAQAELIKLFDDLFGPCGRYRLEWRTTRSPGDDAMFAEIMTADLVRRVQNTIADVSELERPVPPKAIGAAPLDALESEAEAGEAEDDADARFRRAS